MSLAVCAQATDLVSPQTRKRLRMLDAALPDPAIVTIDMIRKDYVLSLAKLQLSRDFPELARSSMCTRAVSVICC